MKADKIIKSIVAGAMVLTLTACGSKSSTESKKSMAESSSQANKKHSSKKNTTQNVKTKATTSSSKSGVLYHSTQSSNTKLNDVKNSDSTQLESYSQVKTMSGIDARNLVKEHLSNQRAIALENGKGEPVQPSVDSVDGFNAKKNSDNDWIVSGTFGGKVYTYHVTPNAVTGS
ncbi:hypothetical protein [Limosilactobacillus coleohominis]|uniref:hypothetical protein n=1 Tax=Limosilactobacillus coleohominis TaxID=181675 RepID=UPI001957AC91|nr:hypothetical protein [Limosilactobacillus coleohominis]MBM6955327.1 hypothetical protein [Limosilactobacillus coleohominis]